jgi:hypothetical protein
MNLSSDFLVSSLRFQNRLLYRYTVVFYTDDAFAEKCYAFWDEKVSDADKAAWVTFLRDLQYNVVRRRGLL